jgi:hypothetical protein
MVRNLEKVMIARRGMQLLERIGNLEMETLTPELYGFAMIKDLPCKGMGKMERRSFL